MTAIRFRRFLLTILAVILFVGPVGAADSILSGGRLRLSHDGTGERENLSFRASGPSFILPEAGVSDARLAFTGGSRLSLGKVAKPQNCGLEACLRGNGGETCPPGSYCANGGSAFFLCLPNCWPNCGSSPPGSG
jgi:hypothetical protein